MSVPRGPSVDRAGNVPEWHVRNVAETVWSIAREVLASLGLQSSDFGYEDHEFHELIVCRFGPRSAERGWDATHQKFTFNDGALARTLRTMFTEMRGIRDYVCAVVAVEAGGGTVREGIVSEGRLVLNHDPVAQALIRAERSKLFDNPIMTNTLRALDGAGKQAIRTLVADALREKRPGRAKGGP